MKKEKKKSIRAIVKPEREIFLDEFEDDVPRVDVSETDTEVKVVANVPGINPEDINIDVQDNWMTISGKSEREVETDKSTRPYRYERFFGEFRREFTLPDRVKEDQVKATCKDGVLTITLPKVEGEKRGKVKTKK